MKNAAIYLLVLLCIGLYAAFINERGSKYEAEQALDRCQTKLVEKGKAALQDTKRPRKY